MNYAKKLLALILLFCMVVNLVPAAFAGNDGETPPTDETVTEAGEEPMPEEPAPEEPIPEVPPDETPPQDEIVPEEPTEQPPEETETVPPDDPAEAPTEEAAEGETTAPDGNVEGITFHVYDASNTEVGSAKTDKDGIINIKGLAVGQTYTVHEDVPEGYICALSGRY